MRLPVTTISLGENDIREVFRQYCDDRGQTMTDFQVYERGREIYVDFRVAGNILDVKKGR